MGKSKKIDWQKEYLRAWKRAHRYENALITLASFGGGEYPEKGNTTVDGSYDDPCSANTAREALGKVICKHFKQRRK